MSDSEGGESAPPDVQHGDEVPADANGAGPPPPAPTHPVWAAAAGRGAGGAPKGGAGSMFAPISMMELELRRRGDLDGASSTASDHGRGKRRSGGGGGGKDKARSKKARRPREYDDRSEEGGEDEEDEDDRASAMGSEPDLAGAAFGGNRKAACVPCGASEVSDDALSVTSTEKRAAHARAFPVDGVHCVGCALPAKGTPVVDFIQKNMANMSELALFKMAGLVYLNKVAEPAEEEGVTVPPWHWKDIRDHFTLHAVDPKFQRFENIRTLGAMRKTIELQLLRRDADSGEMSLDKQNAEQIMKIINLSSRELTLLHDATATKKK